MNIPVTIKYVNLIISALFCCCYAYQLFYILVPFFSGRRTHGPAKYHRYAVLIAARNEEAVLPHLIESIRKQDYPGDLIEIFVVADNCTDGTAEAALAQGAHVYRRFHNTRIGKGYALDFLIQNIYGDFGKQYFDGFFVFDADNLLAENYITEMNKIFSEGFRIVTSYRNSKNYGDNWISAGYALWFLRESKYLNQARMTLGTSCAVSGTGFLMSSDILRECGGWKFYLLTEDIEFTVHNVANGERIGYCRDAVLYDEQPVKFSQSCRQRLRWARGYLQVLRKYGLRLFRGIFRKKGFACFDMIMAIMPAFLLSSLGLAANLVLGAAGLIQGRGIGILAIELVKSFFSSYLFLFGLGLIPLITEWKKIYTKNIRKILSAFTFPIFMMTYIPITIAAMFRRVGWKPIEHKAAVTLEQVKGAPTVIKLGADHLVAEGGTRNGTDDIGGR